VPSKLDAKPQLLALLKTTGFFANDTGTLDVGGPLASLPFWRARHAKLRPHLTPTHFQRIST
jgi:hypothetical protein